MFDEQILTDNEDLDCPYTAENDSFLSHTNSNRLENEHINYSSNEDDSGFVSQQLSSPEQSIDERETQEEESTSSLPDNDKVIQTMQTEIAWCWFRNTAAKR